MNEVSAGEVGPSFLTTVVPFRLDFQGLGPLRGLTKREKKLVATREIFEMEKRAPKVFLRFHIVSVHSVRMGTWWNKKIESCD